MFLRYLKHITDYQVIGKYYKTTAFTLQKKPKYVNNSFRIPKKALNNLQYEYFHTISENKTDNRARTYFNPPLSLGIVDLRCMYSGAVQNIPVSEEAIIVRLSLENTGKPLTER